MLPLWQGRARELAGTREHESGNASRQFTYGENSRENGWARASTLLATPRGNAAMARADLKANNKIKEQLKMNVFKYTRDIDIVNFELCKRNQAG